MVKSYLESIWVLPVLKNLSQSPGLVGQVTVTCLRIKLQYVVILGKKPSQQKLRVYIMQLPLFLWKTLKTVFGHVTLSHMWYVGY